MRDGVMVQSVERAIMILKCFTKDKTELRLRDISEELGINKSTVHGLINTLKHHNFLQQDAETQKYRLGLAVLDLSSRLLNSLDIRNVAGAIIRELCAKTGETIHLVVLEETDVVYIDKQESNQSIRLFTSIGTRYPAYATGVGKAILAYKRGEEVRNHLPPVLGQLTPTTIVDFDVMDEQLAMIRRCGYSVDNEENLEGLSCVAAPIFDHNNEVIAAISIAGPSTRMTTERIPELATEVIRAAENISQRLGCKDYAVLGKASL